MKTNEDIEAYLLQMGRDFFSPQPGVWIIRDEYDDVENIVVVNAPPVITFRVKIMDLPEKRREGLFEQLLRLNANEMVAGAYGVEHDAIVIVDTLQAENLDYNEFEAAIDGLSMAIAMHFPKLRAFVGEAISSTMHQVVSADAEAELAEFGAKLDEESA